jgi:hypothetical protein
MNRLLDIGFMNVGNWAISDSEIDFQLKLHGSQRNILYAFVCDAEVKYVGKTVQPLRSRMYGYKNPGRSQITNIRNHARLKEELSRGVGIDILALPDNGMLHYGQFHYNLAAGLEDSIIAIIKPSWNGTPKPTGQSIVDPAPVARDIFQLVIQPTYFKTGFFNVPVAHSHFFGSDTEPIEIFCGSSSTPISGSINRRSNQNHSPRLMGGVGLRDWFQNNSSASSKVQITVYTPNSIHIEFING